jgi:hypothetical protein
MATLASRAPLSSLADILHAAAVVGPDAWGDGRSDSNKLPVNSKDSGGPNLSGDLAELFSLLQRRSVAYLLVGGVALLRYVDGRNTHDVDLLLSIASLERIPEITIKDRNKDFASGAFKSVPVDLLLTDNPLFKLVQEKYATVHRFAEIDVPCATVEGLILLKLYALPSLYRQGDGQRIGLYENDIFMLCERHRPDAAALLQVVQPFVDEGAFVELGNILAEISSRISRIDRAKGGK